FGGPKAYFQPVVSETIGVWQLKGYQATIFKPDSPANLRQMRQFSAKKQRGPHADPLYPPLDGEGSYRR
ncbi:MAG: hypothetical protein EB015_12000, partial [Methylocystaceae bacterium]|nr:hypothetical protein [Methylocystaceae bacterium]